eukprot:GFYU01029847.1.p2 GENE.GFYU01029847.1~~GFYU01029847.1.p2  ORF type:complete len:111 (+),score=13.44 GFYU01029847.1:494-826(+)
MVRCGTDTLLRRDRTTVFHQGDFDDEIFIVMRGCIGVHVKEDLRYLAVPGYSVFGSTITEAEEQFVSAVAMDKTDVLYLSGKRFRAAMKQVQELDDVAFGVQIHYLLGHA